MQNVKNFFQGKALGVAEYLTPILKVVFKLPEWVMVFITIIIGSDRDDLTLSIITLLTVRSPI